MIIYKNFQLHKMSYVKAGGKVSKIYIPEKSDEIEKLVSKIPADKKIVVFGLASNFLLPDKPPDDCVFVSMKKMRDVMDIEKTHVHISSGYNLMELIYKAAAKGTGENLFPLSGIPGTIGGCVYHNAGGSNRGDTECIGNWIEEIRILDIDKKKIITLDRKDLKFSYRSSVLKQMKASGKRFFILDLKVKLTPTEVRGSKMKIMKYIDLKLKSQPVGKPSLGCVFKNPSAEKPVAWELIEKACAPDLSSGTMEISSQHRNFIINSSNIGLASDYMTLADEIKQKVNSRCNIALEREVEFFSDYY